MAVVAVALLQAQAGQRLQARVAQAEREDLEEQWLALAE